MLMLRKEGLVEVGTHGRISNVNMSGVLVLCIYYFGRCGGGGGGECEGTAADRHLLKLVFHKSELNLHFYTTSLILVRH
jgi:hypothetical protein